MTDRYAHYSPSHPAMMALAALVAAMRYRCDLFPELEAVAARNGVVVGSEEFDKAAALTGQPYCRALDLYVDRETKRRAEALGAGMAHLAFLPA
ncbi:hypothetical protein [Stenotrophomonas maltophilia]|uniref:hypothetical protein n=1 Tax=Stenotrophomonas maltophilia TaxID=40324 RepID=UPI001F533BE8|nr:hypothetical protein [Stenotrophomonas maltophilia]